MILSPVICNSNYFESVFDRLGYKWFDGNKPYNLNIFGIRANKTEGDNESNSFNDMMCVSFRDEELIQHVRMFKATTDPGTYWLENPGQPKGTAILVPGQYPGAYQIALHNGKYSALCQRKPVKVWRDGNKDNVLDWYNDTQDEGLFGINIHHANANQPSKQVDKWSAGCQVVADPVDFANLMHLAYKAEDLYGNSFTYTLLEESDLD